MLKKTAQYILSGTTLYALTASITFAEKFPIDPITPNISTIPQFIKSILDIVFKLGIPVSSIFIIWAGFLFLTAQGDPSKLTKAKGALTWAIIGMAVVLCSWLLATAIQGTIDAIAH